MRKQMGDVKRAEEKIAKIEQDIEDLNRKFMALNENYNATQAEVQELIGEFQETRNARFAQYRDIIFAMRREVNADEWKRLMK